MVILHALGQCLIRTAVTTITPRADMCFALASYLTRERGKRVPRRLLETLFWPGMRAADASHSLSELIHKLRRKGVLIERDAAACIWIPREAAAIDVESLSAEAPAAIADRDLSVLPGYAPRASAAFNDWVDEWRGHMQLRVLNDVVAAISRSIAARDWTLALALADQALKLDAENEAALLARARAAEQLARNDRASDNAAERRRPAHHVAPLIREGTSLTSWAVRRSDSLAADDTPLVGRESQMERLRNQATRALHGAVCAAYVSAPAGIGKSRLVRELAAWMRSNGAAVCTVSCARHDGHRPLSAFIQAVPRLQAIPGAAGCAPSTLACLSRITQLTNDEPQMSARDDTAHLSASIRASVIDLVDAVTDEQPLLLIVEDVHWIDHASWSLLRTLTAKAHHAVFLVCTSRVRWQHALWGEPDTFVSEELSALEPSDARAHMANCLAKLQTTVDDRFVDWCIDTSGGNPYFIEELVNFRVTTGEQYTAPPSLVALTEARLKSLTPDALRVIQAAAVLGKNSTLELLQQVLEYPTHILFSSLEELSEAGLLATATSRDKPGTAPVLCRHDLVILSATRTLSPQGRTLIHHAAARAIESVAFASNSTELLWDCADHWQAAGQSDRSIRAVIFCARHLHDMGLVHESLRCCESALTACCSDSMRVIVLRAMAHSQYSARNWRTFCGIVAEVRMLESASNTTVSIHDDLELCELSAQRNLHRDWEGALKRTLRCVFSIGADAAHRVKAAITALKLATNIGDMETMDAVYREALPLAHLASVSTEDRLTLSMIYHTIRGEASISASTARELLDFAERTLSPWHQLGVLVDGAGALRRSGSPGEAEAVYEAIFATAVPIRCFDYASEACHRLIEMYSEAGQWDRAGVWIRHYRRLRRPKAELRSQRNLRLAIARVLVYERQWEEAADLIDSRTKDAAWEDAVTMFRSSALATKIRIEIGRGRTAAEIRGWVAKLAPLNACLRTTGAQDYESYSLYLGYRFIGEAATATQFLTTYTTHDRRDATPVSPEIAEELARLGLSLGC